MRIGLVAALTAALAAGLAACGSKSPRVAVPPNSAAYSKDAQSLENPWPDSRLGPGVGIRPGWYKPWVTAGAGSKPGYLALFDGWGAELARVDGFGGFAPTLVRFNSKIDQDTLAGAFAYAKADGSAKVDAWVEYFGEIADKPFALVRPKLPLGTAQSWILVLTSSAKAGGKALERTADFDDDAGGKLKDAVVAASKALAVPAGNIVLALPFKTTSLDDDLPKVQQKLATLAPPTPDLTEDLAPSDLSFPPRGVFTPGAKSCTPVGKPSLDCFVAVVETADDGDTKDACGANPKAGTTCHISVWVSGTYPSYDLRSPFNHDNADPSSDDGLFRSDYLANPSIAPTAAVPFVLAVPTGTPPAAGWPVVVLGHGLGSDYRFVIWLAERLASHGIACVGITDVQHNGRGNYTYWFDVVKPMRTREFVRQTTVDEIQLVNMLASGSVAGFPVDPAKITYGGESFGGITGATLLSVESRIPAGVINVPGAGLVNIIYLGGFKDSVGYLLALAVGGAQVSSPDLQGSWQLFRATVQTMVEPADPAVFIGHARGAQRYPHLPADKRILVQEGMNDRTVNNLTTDDLLAAFGGAPLLHGVTADPGGVTGLWRFTTTDYGVGADKDPHGILHLIPQVREQLAQYVQSGGTNVADASP